MSASKEDSGEAEEVVTILVWLLGTLNVDFTVTFQTHASGFFFSPVSYVTCAPLDTGNHQRLG